MTDKKTEALKLALEAFDDRVSLNKWQKARDAVREALAQSRSDEEQPASNVNATGGPKAFFSLAEQPAQQQEPVAWKDRTYGNLHHQDFGNSIPLYTSPPASKPWVGLTDEEQQAAYDAWQQKDDGWGSFYDLIEAKLREKNA